MPVTSALIVLAGMLASFGWSAARPATATPEAGGYGTMPDQIEITYRATGGQPSVALDLNLDSDGQATLFVGSSYSIPIERVSRVGAFGGRAPAAEVDALRAYLGEHDLLARGGSHGQAGPDTPGRFLAITADGQTAELRLSGMTVDAEIDGFEKLLQRLALALTEQPVAAVEAGLDLRRDGDRIAATIELRSIGSEPMTVLLVDPAQPGMTLRARVDFEAKMTLPSGATMPMALGDAVLSPEAVRDLVEDGTLPSGITELSLDAGFRFELPPVAEPRSSAPVVATGTLMFWLPDGQARREVTLLTGEVAVPPTS